jgi:negative regulator of genetic competence, sporulation and motility
MELIPINDSKLKIMLSVEDMTYYKLDAMSMSYGDEHTKNALKAIFKDVKIRSGFDADTQKTYIQIYPDKSGGCEMFVTKLEGEKSRSVHKTSPKSTKRSDSQGSCGDKKENYVFLFNSFENLIKVCRQLWKTGLNFPSSVYKDAERDSYFLILYGANQLSFFSLDEFSFISEFAKRQNGEYSWMYIKEHCSSVCTSDAISVLATF